MAEIARRRGSALDRINAINTLARTRTYQAIGHLRCCIGDHSRSIESSAKDALAILLAHTAHGSGGSPEAPCDINEWITRLQFGDSSLRQAAAKHLGQQRDPRAVRPLLNLLDDSNVTEELRQCAIAALVNLGELIFSDLAAFPAFTHMTGERVITVLQQIGNAQARALLTEFVKGKGTFNQRRCATQALSAIGPAAVASLIDCLNTSSVQKHGIFDALVKIGSAQAIPPLIEFVKGKGTADENRYATQALGEMCPAAAASLVDCLKTNSAQKYNIFEALAKIGSKHAIKDERIEKDLNALLDHTDFFMRLGAARSLAKLGCSPRNLQARILYCVAKQNKVGAIAIGTPAVEALLACFSQPDGELNGKDDLVAFAATALGGIGDLTAVKPMLISRSRHFSVKCDEAVIKALVQIGPRAVPIIIESLSDSNENVRECAIIALGEIGGDQALEALLNSMNILGHNSTIAKALGKMGDVRAVPPLIELLKRELPEAVAALVQIGQVNRPPVAAEMTAAFQTGGQSERFWAAIVLVKLNEPLSTKNVVRILADTITLRSEVGRNPPSPKAAEKLFAHIKEGLELLAQRVGASKLLAPAKDALGLRTRYSGADYGGENFSYEEGLCAINTLARCRDLFASVILHRAAHKKDIICTMDIGNEWGNTEMETDFSPQRELAQAELNRRGLANQDPLELWVDEMK